MILRIVFCYFAIALLVGTQSIASPLLDEFKERYDSLVRQVHNRAGEVIEIDSFTYVKDVATFSFGPGKMLLQRPVNGRPTVAAYVGNGHARIEIPVAAERQAFYAVSKDTTVDEDFTVCFMRLADDLDIQLKKRFSAREGSMPVADYEKIRNAMGEYFFKPTMFHLYDNLAQLLISTYGRKSDGYFWASFNHNAFCFDPTRSEEIYVAHASTPEIALSPAAPRFQRKERSKYTPDLISLIDFRVSMVSLDAKLEMGGSDGWTIKKAEIRTRLVVGCDSLSFPSLFLDPHFEPDSIYCNGTMVDYFRRKDFYHLILLLPSMKYRGDSVDVTIWFSQGGSNYRELLPWVENSLPVLRTLTLNFPGGYNYALPMSGPIEACGPDRFQCMSGSLSGQALAFRPLVTGYDTVEVNVDDRMKLKFVAHDYGDFIKEGEFQSEVVNAFRFFLNQFGIPSQLTEAYIFPFGNSVDPGLLHIPATRYVDELGGFTHVVAQRVAAEWFGPTLQLASYREGWLKSAIPTFLGILYVEKQIGYSEMCTNLGQWKLGVERCLDESIDVPLAIGARGDYRDIVGKGVWLLHMLRVLMRDLQTNDDSKFLAFLHDVITEANSRFFTNTDFEILAEKHFGAELDWFFDPWMNGRSFPQFDGEYTVEQRGDQYYVVMEVQTTLVSPGAAYAVLIGMEVDGESVLLRRAISPQIERYEIGPLTEAPKRLTFNEYESVLCKHSLKPK